jgi:hypothetical protein
LVTFAWGWLGAIKLKKDLKYLKIKYYHPDPDAHKYGDLDPVPQQLIYK